MCLSVFTVSAKILLQITPNTSEKQKKILDLKLVIGHLRARTLSTSKRGRFYVDWQADAREGTFDTWYGISLSISVGLNILSLMTMSTKVRCWLFDVEAFSSQTFLVRLNELNAIGVFFPFHHNAFITGLLRIWAAAANGLSGLDAQFLFWFFLSQWSWSKKW